MNAPAPVAAIYVRVSTDSDAQRDSPQHQVATCSEYALENGFVVDQNKIYNDAGVSGTELQQRQAVQRLLADARQGRFDVVLFTAISRFSRDLSDAFQMKKQLESVYGIRLVSIEEGYDSAVEGRNNEMVFTVHAMLAAHKAKEMSVAIQRGRKQSARRGRHTGNRPPYGYDKKSEGRLVPDPTTAPIVREIYDRCLAGEGTAVIAGALNESGVPTASMLRGKEKGLWQASTVLAILRNPVYTGTIVAHQWQKAHDVLVSRKENTVIKRTSRRKPDDWVVVEGVHEALIDAWTFGRVQEMLNERASHQVRRNTNVLAGLMVCHECGGTMIVARSGRRGGASKSYGYVVCGKVRRLGQSACCNHQRLRYGDVLGVILQYLSAVLRANWSIQDATAIANSCEQICLRRQVQYEDLVTAYDRNRRAQLENLRALQSGIFPESLIVQEQKTLRTEGNRIEEELRRWAVDSEKDGGTPVPEPKQFTELSGYDVVTLQMVLRKLVQEIRIQANGDIFVQLGFSLDTNRSPGTHQYPHQ